MDCFKELIAEYEREIVTTRKMLDAIPADADLSYKPHPKSMSLGRLAAHLAETSGEWAVSTLAKEKVEISMKEFKPWIPATKAEILEKLDKGTAEVKDLLAGFKPEQWNERWKFIGDGQAWVDDPKFRVWRNWVMNHMIHHRAQLGVYLRLLDAPIPGTYGPSADGM